MLNLLLNVLIPAVVVVLLIQAAVLLIRASCRQHRQRQSAPLVPAAPAEIFPGIPVANHASPAEQQALIERLAVLPQMRRLPDGSLVDWMNGTWLTPCDCAQAKTVPHLQVKALPRDGLGMVSREGLAHYLAYQERLAGVLAGTAICPLSRAEMPATKGGAQ